MDFRKLFSKQLPAPLWRRGIAYVIDALLVGVIITLPLESRLGNFDNIDSFTSFLTYVQQHPGITLQIIPLLIALALLTILYWALLEYKLHQSVGKMICNISVVSTTKTFTFGQCFLRNVTKISSLFLFLDILYLFFKGGNQRYFETLSHTEVVLGASHGKN